MHDLPTKVKGVSSLLIMVKMQLYDNGGQMETAESLHACWFGGEADDAAADRQSKLWWSKSAELDAELAARFTPLIDAARAGTLAGWADTPQGALALILLTDQLPRNVYRGTAQAFASDPIARSIAVAGLDQGFDRRLKPIERVFFYLPLEHAESMADQDRSVALYTRLFQEAPTSRVEQYRNFLTYALRHRRVIERFGRFPHRNAIIGRASRPEEIAFLQEPGSSF
jgi:uncharacterized protein (DUF924 family)